jgi:hypothetical protein
MAALSMVNGQYEVGVKHSISGAGGTIAIEKELQAREFALDRYNIERWLKVIERLRQTFSMSRNCL